MRLNKSFHILALLSFALIQCVAPLVHAHVDGIQSNAAFHAHGIPHYQHLISTQELSRSHVESYESAAISIPHEIQRDNSLAIIDNAFTFSHPSSPQLTTVTPASHSSQHISTYAYQKPPTQAPPLA
jgi:hypothetical protein